MLKISNSEGQLPDAFRRGHYAIGKYPVLSSQQRDGWQRVDLGPGARIFWMVSRLKTSTYSSRSSTTFQKNSNSEKSNGRVSQ